MGRFFLAVLLASNLLFFSNAVAAKPLEVVATFSILGDMVRQVGGDAVHVETLVDADSDAHSYRPTPADSKILASADLVVENGLRFEGWLSRLVSASGFKGDVVVASDGVKLRKDGSDIDPHAWQDVSNARIYAKNIAAALVKAKPEESAAIWARGRKYDQELEKLDASIKSELGQFPAEKRKIITSHDAFGYFGDAYGVVFMAPQGSNADIEPTASQVAKLVEQMKREKVRRVFFENMVSSKLIKQLARDAGAEAGKPVYSDALSASGGVASTYIDMIRYNGAQFKEAMSLNGM